MGKIYFLREGNIARLYGLNVYNGNGNEIECKGIKMETRGKLGNDM